MNREGTSFRWREEPRKGTFARFVYIWIDVIGHSQLLAAKEHEGDTADLQWKVDVHAALIALEKFVRSCVPELRDGSREDLLWDWAGDGGLLAFPLTSEVSEATSGGDQSPETAAVVAIVGEKETLEQALGVARLIVEKLPGFPLPPGSEHLRGEIRLRVVVHHGQALYTSEPRHRRSTPLNIAAKVRFPSDRTSLTITEDFYQARARYFPSDPNTPEFAALDGQIDPVKQRQLYGHIRSLELGLEADLERLGKLKMRHSSPRTVYELAFLRCGAGDRDGAQAILSDAIGVFRRDDSNEPFWYRRTWVRFFEAWHYVLEHEPPPPTDEERRAGHDSRGRAVSAGAVRMAYLRSDEVRDEVNRRWRCGASVLLDMELILAQTRLLADRYVDAPSGLSTMQVCRLLLRAGHSPFEPNIRRRLDRIGQEMDGNDGKTIDGDCSLCTATAVSCLALSGRFSAARPAINWLTGLERYRYCYHRRSYSGAKAHEHALHYAAAVLEAFGDLPVDETSRSLVTSAFRVFDNEGAIDDPTAIGAWMRYRNISELEIFAYAFSALLHSLLQRRVTLEPHTKAWFERSLGHLLERLEAEKGSSDKEYNFYALRQNLAGFALAAFLGTDVLRDSHQSVLEDLAKRSLAACNDDERIAFERTMDSNSERTRTLVEGWLWHRETELALEESPREPAG